VCSALDIVAKDDWPVLPRRHPELHSNGDAMAGPARAGCRLYHDDQPTESFRQDEVESEASDLDNSIGLQVHVDGAARSVVWDGPGFIGVLAPCDRITAVNGQPFVLTTLEQAVKTANSSALSLTFEVNSTLQTTMVDYSQSLRFPHLERFPGTVDRRSPPPAPRN